MHFYDRKDVSAPLRKKTKKTAALTSEQALRLLQRELEKERRHSAALEREVAALKEEVKRLEDRDPEKITLRKRQKGVDPRLVANGKMRDAASRRAHHYRRSSYIRYMFESMMESLPVRILAQLILYLRRLRVVRVVATIVMAVGTVVLVTILSATMLPFLFIGTVILAIWAGIRSRRMNRIMRRSLNGHHLRVFFPPRGASWEGDSFFMRQARAMAREEGVAVLIVSPYSLSRRGPGKKRFYFTARRDEEDLYVIRRHYFFFVRKRVLDVVDPDMTVVY